MSDSQDDQLLQNFSIRRRTTIADKGLSKSEDPNSEMVPKAQAVSYDNTDLEFDKLSLNKRRDDYETTSLMTASSTKYTSSNDGSSLGSISSDNDGHSLYKQLESNKEIVVNISARHRLNSINSNDSDVDDESTLLPMHNKAKNSSVALSVDFPSNKNFENKQLENAGTIGFQILFPFLMAGMGMVAAGVVLDKVQHWEVFTKVPEIFILVPALLGLKGNLEMTLASRLSTYANQGLLDGKDRFSILWGNMVLVEAQAMVVAFLASLVAMTLGWIPDGKWETNHALILCAGSLLTGAIASFLLGGVMVFVILLSQKFGINPDNVATPIAASLGDLVTLLLLSQICKGLYWVLYDPNLNWIGWAIIVLFIFLTPLFLFLSHRNNYTREVVKHGWEPVIAAMAISSTGGFILDFAVSQNPGVAVFSPVINGVGGNLVAVQASRISTYLHTGSTSLGVLPRGETSKCVSPCQTFCGRDNRHSVSARVMLLMVTPGQIIFVLIIQALEAGHTTITPQFVAVYVLVSLIQVSILLQVCQWLVLRLWRKGVDPDNSAIPYLTALGDLLGTGLLAAGFLFLWLVGDRDSDVGDK